MAPKRHAASSPAPATSTAPKQSTTTTSTTPAPISFTAKSPFQDIIAGIWQQYITQTAQRTLLLDVFMGFLIVVGAVQFVYCVVAGNYPFNAFLSGFSAAVGQFVLTASLRMQTSDQGLKKGGKSVSKSRAASSSGAQDSTETTSERAFADYIFGSMILHFFCVNFIN